MALIKCFPSLLKLPLMACRSQPVYKGSLYHQSDTKVSVCSEDFEARVMEPTCLLQVVIAKLTDTY